MTIAATIGAVGTLAWVKHCWQTRPEGARLWHVTRWLRPRIDMDRLRSRIGGGEEGLF